MPFKWRLKKTRKYDISTKNLFIVGVYLLDNAYLECTLTAESTGQECLNSIAQRIELAEYQYFGLRYVTKKLHFHWVDLEKPLKKQLDKYAQPASHPHSLYFSVMFYIIGAHKIPDEVARYHYYLQLKTDIIDGRVPCSTEQAIRLAAYSLQAEFGDYELDKYVAEDYLLFPKTMVKEEGVATELLSEAVAGHARLKGMPPLQAELQYVKEVQMMDGYGTEYYNAKDESRKDLYLGTSYAGMFARYIDGQSTVYYKWAEIAKVTQNKKSLEIDTPKSSVQFQLEDADTAKYVCRIAQLQTQFYKSNKGNLSSSLADVSLSEELQDKHHVDAHRVFIPPRESSHSSQELAHSQVSLTHSQEQRYAQGQEHLQSSQQSLESSESQHQFHHHPMSGMEAEVAVGNGIFHHQMARAEPHTPNSEGDPIYVNRAALLPAYRPSPDYEAVMQRRMLQQHEQHPQSRFDDVTPHLGTAQVYVHPDGIAYSQPEISQNIASYMNEHGNYANVDALRNYSHSIYANIFQDGYYPGRGCERGNSLAVHPTYSSPELNTDVYQQESFSTNDFSTQEALSYHFRPPPPYPRTSSSTPDLAVQPTSTITSDQPDIVLQNLMTSAERAGLHGLVIQSRLDRSVDDLSGFPIASTYSVSGIRNITDLNHEVNNSAAPLTLSMKNQPLSGRCLEAVNVSQTAGDTTEGSQGPSGEGAVVSECGNKILSEDPDDTSSEHSYSTFHARESEESSEEECTRLKLAQNKNESKIQIKMFAPQEAPPPSKIKEEATLRESFRRMKIARTGSLNRDVSGPRSSLCGVKETVEGNMNLSVAGVRPTESGSAQPSAPHFVPSLTNPTAVAKNVAQTDISETLGQLGTPPPYPGKPSVPDLVSDAVMARDAATATVMSRLAQTKPVTVKRSSSAGTAPTKTGSVISPGREQLGTKPRANTFNLDTVVPVSKPGMVRLRDPDVSSKAENHPLACGTDGMSDKLSSSTSDRDVNSDIRDDGSDIVTSLQDYSVGSDTDSDHEQSQGDSHINVGPLRMAALNGLTLSRSVVLSLMNDESRAPTDDRRKMLESKISEGQVYAEFEQIPRKSESLDCAVAKAPHNALRNRFKDVLPYDVTRVKLTPRKDNPDGYINASHLKLTANDTKWLFIATQAPLANTVMDFWQMVWESRVDVITMLTPFQELGKSKCFVYWPQEPGAQHRQHYGEYEVELQFTDDSLCYLTSRIILRNGGRERMVWHLQYTDWPDHGCPEDTYGFLGFLDEIESVSRLSQNESGQGERSPVVVHCSAGVGRTGVVILTMVMKWCLEHNHNVDLPKALSGIRSQRMHMVQTVGQYRFIHDTLIQYLKNTRLI